MWAQEIWTIEELRKHVSSEILENIRIQSEVLEMDPEFSFYKIVFEEPPEPVRPLGTHFQKHSSTG
jgi:hypothetical protein